MRHEYTQRQHQQGEGRDQWEKCDRFKLWWVVGLSMYNKIYKKVKTAGDETIKVSWIKFK